MVPKSQVKISNTVDIYIQTRCIIIDLKLFPIYNSSNLKCTFYDIQLTISIIINTMFPDFTQENQIQTDGIVL
jgi:hypothetical protein